jgi:hypothetical protein
MLYKLLRFKNHNFIQFLSQFQTQIILNILTENLCCEHVLFFKVGEPIKLEEHLWPLIMLVRQS